MPELRTRAALPRVTSQALAMRPRTRRIFGAISFLAIVLSTLLGAVVAALGERLSGPAASGAAFWGGVGAFVAACLGVSAVPFARRLLIARAEVRLIEAASPLHPLLKRLMIEAPGTYAHSLATASLAEAGAEVVGADPLLARVGAYYHDIGKVRRPCFFFENIVDGENPHDTAKPSLSALVITAHVTDGLELADEYDLPMGVRDIIREHHGTSLIRYFFHKASSMDPGVSEGDFRYHGGRPTTREAALVMLADSAEASVRALSAPCGGPFGASSRTRLRTDSSSWPASAKETSTRWLPLSPSCWSGCSMHGASIRASCPRQKGVCMQISIVSHRDPELLDMDAFTRLASFVLEREDAPVAVELSIAIVSLAEMTELNGRFRQKDGPTDVLSFPCDDPCAVVEPGEPVALGDVVIAPEVAERQAAEYGHTVEDELNLLLVHGVLHLLGYDHIEDDDAGVMQAREVALLTAWAAAT